MEKIQPTTTICSVNTGCLGNERQNITANADSMEMKVLRRAYSGFVPGSMTGLNLPMSDNWRVLLRALVAQQCGVMKPPMSDEHAQVVQDIVGKQCDDMTQGVSHMVNSKRRHVWLHAQTATLEVESFCKVPLNNLELIQLHTSSSSFGAKLEFEVAAGDGQVPAMSFDFDSWEGRIRFSLVMKVLRCFSTWLTQTSRTLTIDSPCSTRNTGDKELPVILRGTLDMPRLR